MFKGIRLTFGMTLLFTLALPSAFAASDEEIGGAALKACKRLGGNYSVDRLPLEEDGNKIKECAKVRCSVSTSGAGGVTADDVKAAFPNASDNGGTISGWKTVCKTHDRTSDDDFIVDIDGDGDLDVDWDGGAGGQFYIDGVLVTESEWRRRCIKKNGKIRRKCTRGRAVYDDVYYDADVYGPGGGGRYVIVRRSDGSTFKCTYDKSWDHCLEGEGSVIVSVHGDVDHCVNCEGKKKGGGVLSGIAEIAGAVLPPLAYLGSNWLWSDAYLGANQAWAGAAATGFEQCQIMQTNHMHTLYGHSQAGSTMTLPGGSTVVTNDLNNTGYFAANELPHEYIAPPNCNGYHLGGFAGGMGFMGNGMGGFGNPWMQAGYSPGFMAGMYGPYGMNNPYGGMGMGMGMGHPGMGVMGMGYPGMGGGIGINLGLGGGMGGMGMGYPGMGGGIGIGVGGMGGMGYPGMGGMGYPGMGGMGYPGIGGGIGIGMGGYPGMGGIGMGGYPGMGGMGYPGMGGGIGINGGIGGMGGMGYPGFGGGMYGYPGAGGAGGMGTVPWGNGAGSYWNGSGGWGGGGYGGGQYGANYGNIQQSYASNQQAIMSGNYYQQAALQNTYGQAAQNLWSHGYGGGMYGGGMGGGYGYAPYSPGNMGLSMNLGWGFGF